MKYGERLVMELTLAGMTEIKQGNVYIRGVYLPAFND